MTARKRRDVRELRGKVGFLAGYDHKRLREGLPVDAAGDHRGRAG